MIRRTLLVVSTFLMAMVLAAPAMAGFRGGAIVRIDHGPDELIAGETHEVMYTILWMGETPVAGESAVEFWPAKGDIRSGGRDLLRSQANQHLRPVHR